MGTLKNSVMYIFAGWTVQLGLPEFLMSTIYND